MVVDILPKKAPTAALLSRKMATVVVILLLAAKDPRAGPVASAHTIKM